MIDDWFTTVDSDSDKPIDFAKEPWSDLFAGSRYQYPFDEDQEVPGLSQEWQDFQDYQQKRDRILQISNSFVHWYGKTSRPGRKLGHVTVVLDQKQLAQAKSVIKQIESVWYEEN